MSTVAHFDFCLKRHSIGVATFKSGIFAAFGILLGVSLFHHSIHIYILTCVLGGEGRQRRYDALIDLFESIKRFLCQARNLYKHPSRDSQDSHRRREIG